METYIFTLFCLAHSFFEELHSPLISHEHCFSFALSLSFLIGKFAFFYFYAIFTRQLEEGIMITDTLFFHNEIYGRAPLMARETVAEILPLID